jgi:predicted ArsR family transcriptional regulator
MRQGLTAVSSLEDPVRARLYRVVSDSTAPVDRDEAAAAAGIGRPLAAYHLDRLVELGLLTATYRRPAGRAGPGAGRPAKVYALSGREFAVSVPPREYELAARLLASAVEADCDGASGAALRAAARRFGCDLGRRCRADAQEEADPLAALQSALRSHGFKPWQDEDGSIQLRNCPFHSLAQQHQEMVCGMNLTLMLGLIEGLNAPGLTAELAPQPGRCCVVIAPVPQTAVPQTAVQQTPVQQTPVRTGER